MAVSPPRYRLNLYLLGDEAFVQNIGRTLAALDFIKALPIESIDSVRDDFILTLACLDFNQPASLQKCARIYSQLNAATVHKLAFIRQPAVASPEHLLFCSELGVRLAASGPQKESDLKSYLKRMSLQYEEVGSLISYEDELARVRRTNDVGALKELDRKLALRSRESDDILRLRVEINRRLKEPKKVENFLRRMLEINPHNLWAANELGRFYLEQHRPHDGITLLKRLSRYHELNSERLLTLGEAYLNVGQPEEAESALVTGQNLIVEVDPRFQENLAKVRLLQNDMEKASSYLPTRTLTTSVISFLNTRAILAIRSHDFDEGFRLYLMAIKGSDDRLTLARLNYNMGLGKVRARVYPESITYFEKSLELGRPEFIKAQNPLRVVKKWMADQKPGASDLGRFEGESGDYATSLEESIARKLA